MSYFEVRMGIKRPSAGNEKGHYVATVFKDKVYTTSRSASLDEHGHDIAYEIICACSEELAKEYKAKIILMTQSDLDSRMSGKNEWSKKGNTHTVAVDTKQLAAVKAFSSMNVFRAFVKAAYEHYGEERCTSVLNDGARHLKDLVKQDKERAKNQSTADQLMAESLFDVFQQTNIDMSSSIDNKAVLTIYNELRKGSLNV